MVLTLLPNKVKSWPDVLAIVHQEAKKIHDSKPSMSYADAVQKAWKTDNVELAHKTYNDLKAKEKKKHGNYEDHSYTAHEVEGGGHKRITKKPAKKSAKKTIRKTPAATRKPVTRKLASRK